VTTAPTTGGPWLAVIDMQRVFGDPGSPWAAPRFGEITGPVRELAGAFAPRVSFTRFIAPARPQGAWQEYYRQWPFALQPPDAELWQLAGGLADGLPGEPAGSTVVAPTFSKWGDELAARTGPGGHLVLCGVSTDCCVLSTALAAADAGITVTVVADACAGVDDTSHAQALAIMALYGPLVRVASLADGLALAAGPP
jgi:nicotinamidase-related amidase